VFEGIRQFLLTRELSRHAVEQLVLFAEQCTDGTLDDVALTSEGVGVAPGVAGFGLGQRRLGHERAQSRFLGLLFEERELLGGDGELGAHPLDPIGGVNEPAAKE
jgi:hypothetical protein